MKKIVVCLMCILLILSVSACNKTTSPVSSNASDVAASDTVQENSAVSEFVSSSDGQLQATSSLTNSVTVNNSNHNSNNMKPASSSQTASKNPSGVLNPYDTKPAVDTAGLMAGMKSQHTDTIAANMKKQIRSATSTYKNTGKTYYVSNTGNDNNKGTSPDQAWATIDHINSLAFQPGDAILFERGGIFRSSTYCLNTFEGVTYGAYGTGDKPCIYGASENGITLTWSKYKDNVWLCEKTYPSDVGLIVFNHGEMVGEKQLWSVTKLKKDYDFFYDSKAGKLYLYMSKGNPSKVFKDIEICVYKHLMELRTGMTIDNLCLKYCASHCISGNIGISNTKVTNCEIGWIGGALQNTNIRYGNAIQFWGKATDSLVENNYIYQVYDTAITPQFQGSNKNDTMGFKNLTFRGNLIEYCTTAYEYFLNQDETKDGRFENILVENNVCRFNGYGWGAKARVTNFMASYGIGGLTGHNNAVNYVIRNNIIDQSEGAMIDCRANYKESLPKMSGNTYIQKRGGYFGYWVEKTTTPTPKLINFDDNLASYLKAQNIESDAKLIFID